MRTFSSTLDIARAPEAVYAYATDPLKFAEWQADVVSVEWEGAGGRVGSRFMTTRRVPGGSQSYTQEVTDAVPFRSWAASGIAGVLRPNASLEIEPIDDGHGSRVTFTLSYVSSGAGRLLLPLVERATPKQSERSYERLKQNLERAR